MLKQYQTPAGIQIKPRSGRIAVVTESRISPSSRIAGLRWTGAPAAEVREKFHCVKPLGEITVGRRC
jgi:hypothetical protein